MDKAPWKVMVFVTILVAIIGCVATIAAALIGRLPPITVATVATPMPPPPMVQPIVTPQSTAIPQPPPTAQPTAVPVLGPASTQVSTKDGMTLLYVSAGEFTMGAASSDLQADPWERPQHQVYLDAFWIDQTEVTNAMYAQCVQAMACQAPSHTTSYTRASYYGNAQFDTYPVVYVSWNDAKAYCQWASGDLPTEAQWEKAARGDDQRTYPWGNDPISGSRLNFCDANCPFDRKDKSINDGYADTAPVGNYPDGASPCGALDLVGNVWEWVADRHGSYPSSPSSNPTGPTLGDARVLRGGSWIDAATVVRASVRAGSVPELRDGGIGFRCAR